MKRKALCIVVFLMGCSCSVTPYVTVVRYGTGDYQTSKVFEKPYDTVWNAVMNVFQAYPIRTIDKESGIIVTDVIRLPQMPEYKIGSYPKGKEPEGSMIITEVYYVIEEQTPSGYMRCNVRVEKIDETHTKVSINIISTLYYSTREIDTRGMPLTVQKEFETASRGYLESVLLWKIAKELGINEPEPQQPKF